MTMIRTARVDIRAAYELLMSQFNEGLRMTPEQRRQFAEDGAPARLQHFLFSGLAALLFFNSFLLSDRYMVPDVFDLAVTMRLYVITPGLMAVILLGYLARAWWLQHVPPWATETIAMIGTILVAASLGVVMLATDSPQVSIYRAGLGPILVFGNLVQRLRFRYALVSTLFTLGIYVVTWAHFADRHLPYSITDWPLGLLLVLVAVYSLTSNFNLEMDERQSFLQKERARHLRDELEDKNGELKAMSRLDPLTGLPNRRQFDEYVDTLMSSRSGTQKMAVLLMDVDHFKAFNDRYGHPAGDQCLRLVASALQSAMRDRGGLLARWGGEEFAVVMPGIDGATAQTLGAALCQRVEGLAMRHEASTTTEHVTISCGVAVSRTLRDVHDVERLLHQADSALYEAKSGGRNRCVLA